MWIPYQVFFSNSSGFKAASAFTVDQSLVLLLLPNQFLLLSCRRVVAMCLAFGQKKGRESDSTKGINTGPLSLRSSCMQRIRRVAHASECQKSMKVLLKNRRKLLTVTGDLKKAFSEKLTFVLDLEE